MGPYRLVLNPKQRGVQGSVQANEKGPSLDRQISRDFSEFY